MVGQYQIGGAFWMAVAGTVRKTETDRENQLVERQRKRERENRRTYVER